MKGILKIAIIVIFISLSLGLGKSIYNQASKFKEIYRAENELAKLKKDNASLKTKLEQEKEPQAVEKQARDKLGYQREGDVLYVIPEGELVDAGSQKNPSKNWQEWLNLLFR